MLKFYYVFFPVDDLNASIRMELANISSVKPAYSPLIHLSDIWHNHAVKTYKYILWLQMWR